MQLLWSKVVCCFECFQRVFKGGDKLLIEVINYWMNTLPSTVKHELLTVSSTTMQATCQQQVANLVYLLHVYGSPDSVNNLIADKASGPYPLTYMFVLYM